MEALETDGLDLDVVEQLRGLALKENETEEPDVDRTTSVFDRNSVSTKVKWHVYVCLQSANCRHGCVLCLTVNVAAVICRNASTVSK